MQYRMPHSSIFNGSFVVSILRNTATTYTCRIFTGDPDRAYMGQLILPTAGDPPPTGQIESAIREQARGLDAATVLAWNLRKENPAAYERFIAPMKSSYPPDTSGES